MLQLQGIAEGLGSSTACCIIDVISKHFVITLVIFNTASLFIERFWTNHGEEKKYLCKEVSEGYNNWTVM